MRPLHTTTQPHSARRTEAHLAAVTARSTSVLAAEGCRRAAPDALELRATPLRLPPVPGGVPPHPVILATAALATANAAVALALELATAHGEANAIDLILLTAKRTASAARDAIDTLESADTPTQRQLLAHATAQATHAAAEALATHALAGHFDVLGQSAGPEYTFPRAWRNVVEHLGSRLYGQDRATAGEWRDPESVAAAEVAYDAAAHAVQACSLRFPRLGACSAAHRVARATCLASTFAGWAALEHAAIPEGGA